MSFDEAEVAEGVAVGVPVEQLLGVEEESEGNEEKGTGGKGYDAVEIKTEVFELLELPQGMVLEVQNAWAILVQEAESREAVGEAIFKGIFEMSSGLESMFKMPRAVLSWRFMLSLSEVVSSLSDPQALKVAVETLAFQHLEVGVSEIAIAVFRDAIVELLASELGDRLTPHAREGWYATINYVGGALIYVRVQYADRLKMIASSWALASTGAALGAAVAAAAGEGETGETQAGPPQSGSGELTGSGEQKAKKQNQSVPTSFNEMFVFNAAVMGYGNQPWMAEMLGAFDAIVTNVSNSFRMQEECELLALTLDKMGDINFNEYKAVMLASLRSLVPKDWDSAHEVAWTWLWENVERLVKAQLGKPQHHERALDTFFGSLEEASRDQIRRSVYGTFFALAPAGMDIFKQSATRLHFIAEKPMTFSIELYKDPKRTVVELSALGLRHVGYDVPTELFPPFVNAWVQVIRPHIFEDAALEGFRWSMNLISRILTRVINEGSTIVMKAININNTRMLKKALSCAPRGQREQWVLKVQVGMQAISPLLWAIETGSREVAHEIIVDLLTIRADRDRYYYGMNSMFERHPDIIRILGIDAPGLLPVLLDGLIWRSRASEQGMRRANFYIKHLLVDAEGGFSKTLEWIADREDPKIVCHPCVSMVTDMVWNRVVYTSFLLGRSWFMLTLLIFIFSQSILADQQDLSGKAESLSFRVVVFACRVFVFFCSGGQWLFYHARSMVRDFHAKDFATWGPLKYPAYLSDSQGYISLALTVSLMLMLCQEPIVHCIPDSDYPLFSSNCPAGLAIRGSYSVFSCIAMLMYYLLLVDLAVFSTRVSAFVLVFSRVLPEVFQFVFAISVLAVAFAVAVQCLEQYSSDFAGIPVSFVQFLKVAFGMFRGGHWMALQDWPILMVAVCIYMITSIAFLGNLLIGQLSCMYQTTYQDMVGYARLNRARIVVTTMASVKHSRWEAFRASLKLEKRIEFGEGDIGLAGGIQLLEPSSTHITTTDTIRRFGGSTALTSQWPEDAQKEDEDDRAERIEKMMKKMLNRAASASRGSRSHSESGSGLGASASGSKTDSNSHEVSSGSHSEAA